MPPTDAEVADRLREILRSQEFQEHFTDKVLSRLLEWLSAWLPSRWSLGKGTRWVVMAACLALIIAACAYLWRIYLGGRTYTRKATKEKLTRAKSPLTPEALWTQARELSSAGNTRDAARALQQAFLLRMCVENNVAWTPTRSDWEWLGLFKASSKLAEFTRRTQSIAFGTSTGKEHFDACLDLYERWSPNAGSKDRGHP